MAIVSCRSVTYQHRGRLDPGADRRREAQGSYGPDARVSKSSHASVAGWSGPTCRSRMTAGSMGSTDFRRICGPPVAVFGLAGELLWIPKPTGAVGLVGYIKVSFLLTVGGGGIGLTDRDSIPGSATGTISSAKLLSSVKLSLASKPFAAISTDTSAMASSSNGSGRGGGGSSSHAGSGSVDPLALWFAIACSRQCIQSSCRCIALSLSLRISAHISERGGTLSTKLTPFVPPCSCSGMPRTVPG
jgi:hypothetical protein